MKTNRHTQRQLEFLKAGYLSMNIRSLTSAFNSRFKTSKTEAQVKSTLANHKITCGRKGKDKLTTWYRIFSPDQVQFIRDNYTGRTVAEMTMLFNRHFRTHRSRSQIRNLVRNRKIRSGLTGQFRKGIIPWNTGTKGLTHANSGTFKKGNIPANLRPVGSERYYWKYGVLLKVAERNPYAGFPTRWKLKYVHIWEKANGPVPKGKVVAFIDGDNRNCDIKNLMLISRAELLRLNKHEYKDTPSKLKPSVLALTKLEVKTFARQRVAA